MPFKYVVDGNIFDAQVEALVNPVNCVGVMGAGLAKQFKRKFPLNFNWYASACNVGKMVMGEVLVNDFQAYNDSQIHRYIVNFPTKIHWRDRSANYFGIETGLWDLDEKIEAMGIKSIAIPPLGCGLGGLRWEDVKSVIECILDNDNVEVHIYERKKIWSALE